jgi:DNA-directed RNA polymerase subunit alpha
MAVSEIVFPTKLDIETQTDNYGKFIAEPFESGYGYTIGNSLRRILLSSLEGAAITACRIKGVLHEYEVIRNVKEDVLTILLNLKKIRLKMYSKGTEILKLSVKGSKVVTAGDIQPNSNVDIVNPDQVIATISPGGSLEMELEVERGRGYVVAENNKKHNYPANTIFLDTLFSPVTKVTYEVENTRIGQKTDYDRLILEIWTDGTILPRDALAYSAKILKDSCDIFLFGEKKEEKPVSAIEVIQQEKLNELIQQPIEILQLSSRPFNCLKNYQIKLISDLVKKTENELIAMENLGKKSLEEIKAKLAEHNLSLGMKI